MITDEILDFYFYCQLKAKYKINNLEYTNLSYHYLHEKLKKKTKYFFNSLQFNTFLLRNYILKNQYCHLLFPYIEFDNSVYTPIFLSNNLKINKEDKDKFLFKSIMLSEVFLITHYKVISYNGIIKKYKVQNDSKLTLEIVILNLKKDLQISKISHCSICEYQKICHNELKEKDDLRLLSSLSETEVTKWNERGYFNITQFSYYYKPRRRSLITSTQSRYKFELKALAIKNDKIYQTNDIKLLEKDIEIFVDFESLPSEKFVYLIGIVVSVKNKVSEKISFWADSKRDEEKIFIKFFDYIEKFDNCNIYHYGNYEVNELNKFNKIYDNKYTSIINNIVDKSINILKYFYSYIYPPTYSNSLKDIAHYIGFNWTKKEASGLLSIVWRKNFDFKNSRKFKRRLVLYNIEDCLALYYVKNWIVKLNNEKIESINLNELYNNSGFKFGNINFKIKEYDSINKTAYFDYQRNKIYIRDKTYKKEIKKVKISTNNNLKSNTIEYTTAPEYCVNCLNTKFYTHEKNIRNIIDLKFTTNGIKRWIIEYHGYRFRCSKCKHVSYISKYDKKRFGNNIKIWIIYNYLIFHNSTSDIVKMLYDIFKIQITRTMVINIKQEFALKLIPEYENILNIITSGQLLHIDETTVTIKKKKHYVWVLTNLTHIYYVYREDRTVDFLNDILENFTGVMISDYYTGYDSFKVKQQKCLVHLMRDINDLIFKYQDDFDLIYIGRLFGSLLGIIIKTIDKYGLKKRNLNKHNKDVVKFYKQLNDHKYQSSISKKLKNRFIKNQSKLFTFLNYDGIPWNNNNVEHAIKDFAEYRKYTDGMYSEVGLQNYLILLSISKTCSYQNISFLEYLKKYPQNIK